MACVKCYPFGQQHTHTPPEPILLPRVRIQFADFPYPRSSTRPEAAHLEDLLRISVRPGGCASPCVPLQTHTGARGRSLFTGRRGRSGVCIRSATKRHITHACRAQATQFGRADFPGSRRGKPPSPAKPIPEPARLLPPARTLASERADNSSRGPRRRRQRPCRGVAALYVQ